MAKCFNRNTEEYKSLLDRYEEPIIVDSIINGWQVVTKSSALPTLFDAEQFIERQRIFYSIQKKNLADSILYNLSPKGKGLISKVGGDWYINNTAEGAIKGDLTTLKNNRNKVERILDFWQVNEEAIIIEETEKSFRINIDPSKLTTRDSIIESKDITHASDIIQHLTRMFPDVAIKVMNEKDARSLYDSLPQFKEIDGRQYQRKQDFKEVKSFYADGNAILVKGRITSETVIEEVLHPFISSLAYDQSTLFNSLVKESRSSFPMLYQTIESTYNNTQGFDKNYRDQELVTQALSRHFKKEYEQVPTRSFRSKIKQLMEWLMDVFRDLSKYIIGKDLVLYPGMLDSANNLSALAKVLNTSDLQFNVERVIEKDRMIRFKLSDKHQEILDDARGKAKDQNIINVIDGLMGLVENSKKAFGDYTVSMTGKKDHPLVIRNKADKKYINVENPDQKIVGTTTQIGGHMSQTHTIKKKDTIQSIAKKFNTTPEKIKELNAPKFNISNLTDPTILDKNSKPVRMQEIYVPQTDFDTNLDIGNDFDSIVQSAVLNEGVENLDLKIVNKNTAEDFYKQIRQKIATYTERGGLMLPQVVVASSLGEGIAGTIDLLFIDTDGTLEIIDLKTSKDSLNTIINGKNKYREEAYPVSYGSKFYDPSKKHNEQQRFTKQQMQNLQVGVYAQILANQGYQVEHTITWHVHTPTTGKGVNQKYTQRFVIEDAHFHYGKGIDEDVYLGDPEDNNLALENLIPNKIDETAQEKLYNIGEKTGTNEVDLNAEEAEAEAAEQTEQIQGTESSIDVLMDFKTSITTRKENMKSLTDQKIFYKSGKEVTREIDRVVGIINLGIIEGNPMPVFRELVKDSIQELEDFITYVKDPDSYMNDQYYINKVLNFSKMVNTFEGLSNIKDQGLSKADLKLVKRLSNLIGDVNGIRDGIGNIKPGKEGVINEAILNFAKGFVIDTSRRDFSEKELMELLTFGKDITGLEYQTGTMATSSDTILALMDKIFKRKKQEVLDKIDERNREIRRLGQKIERLGGGKPNYSFMIVFDDDGIPTGRYVQKTGKQYWDKRKKISDLLIDEIGDPKDYIIAENYNDLTKEEREYNITLYYDRQKFKRFMRAEKIVDGEVEDGEYHKYNKEFQEEREKFMYFDGNNWQKRRRVSHEDYIEFRTKYYQSRTYYRANFSQDRMNGHVIQKRQGWFVKSEYVEIRDESSNGEKMTDDKWRKLQNPKTELGIAQKEFYDMYVKYFEEDLLKKLPMRVVQQMHGKLPLIKDTAFENLKKGPSLMANLWAKVKAAPRDIKDFFLTNSQKSKIVLTGENGEFIDTLPIFYVGSAKSEEALERIDNKIKAEEEKYIKEKSQGEKEKIKSKIEDLKGRRARLQNKPEFNELSLDMADNLMRFSKMAENYEVMSGIEDTLQTMIKVLQGRKYDPAAGEQLKTYIKGRLSKAGIAYGSGLKDPNVVRRAKKWMRMTFYDNDEKSQNVFDKLTNKLISYTSFTYVGANPWGNLNNYVIGRMNNLIETAGGRWYNRRAGFRAEKEFNERMIPDFFKRMGSKTALNDMLGVSGRYDKYTPGSKYEALVALFRMMDDKADIREVDKVSGKESITRRVMSWGYMLQDSAEYNVQTKVGMAILMSTKIYKSSDPKGAKTAIPLFDAYTYNQKTGDLRLKDGYDSIMDYQTGKVIAAVRDKNGNVLRSDITEARYELRQYIRETNIHIHGNYAYEDRMVMQSHSLGKLAAQFHKWIAPAIKARYRPEYFDENLGWIQGRYLSFWSFMTHVGKNLTNARQATKDWKNIQGDRAEMKLKNVYRTTAELGLVMMTFMMKAIFTHLWDDEDEEGAGTAKRFQNAFMYQLDRQRRELLQFIWIGDAYMLMKSPISSTRMMKEMGEAMLYAVQTPYLMGKEGALLDKRIYYQTGTRKGQLRLWKETRDAMPILYALNRWWSYDRISNFWVD